MSGKMKNSIGSSSHVDKIEHSDGSGVAGVKQAREWKVVQGGHILPYDALGLQTCHPSLKVQNTISSAFGCLNG